MPTRFASRFPTRFPNRFPASVPAAALLAAALCATTMPARAGDDVRVLLELLMEKGLITQAEYDAKLKKAQEMEEIRAFNEAQEVRRVAKEVDARAEKERKFKTEFYGQVSAGYYNASNMKNGSIDASGMSDQPKGNNRVGLKISRELDADVTAMVTLESNFSARTGAIGKDAGASGVNNAGSTSSPYVGAILDREANFRVMSKTYGTLIIGRGPNLQNDLSGAFDPRQNWKFGGLKAIGRYAGFHSASGISRADKLFRYISPSFSGLTLDGAVSVGGVPGDSNYGTGTYIGGRYRNGNFEAGYNHISAALAAGATNNDVHFLGLKYTIDKLTLSGGVAFTTNPHTPSATLSTTSPGGRAHVDTGFGGFVYRLTPTLSVNGAYYQVRDKTPTAGANDIEMFATGLTWTPYKDWDLFIDYANANRRSNATAAFTIYDAWRPDTASPSTLAAGTKPQSGVSIGAQYKF